MVRIQQDLWFNKKPKYASWYVWAIISESKFVSLPSFKICCCCWWIVFAELLTNKNCLASFPTGTIVKHSHHYRSLTCHKQNIVQLQSSGILEWRLSFAEVITTAPLSVPKYFLKCIIKLHPSIRQYFALKACTLYLWTKFSTNLPWSILERMHWYCIFSNKHWDSKEVPPSNKCCTIDAKIRVNPAL